MRRGCGEAGGFVAGGLIIDGLGEAGFFDRPGAAETPIAGGHFLDEAGLEVIDGAEAVQETLKEAVNGLLIFGWEDDTLSQESVAESILGGAATALGADGAAGQAAIGAGSGDAAKRRQGRTPEIKN